MRRGIDDRTVTQKELEDGLYGRTIAPERQEEIHMKFHKGDTWTHLLKVHYQLLLLNQKSKRFVM